MAGTAFRKVIIARERREQSKRSQEAGLFNGLTARNVLATARLAVGLVQL